MIDLKISKELICEVLKIKSTSEFNYRIEDNQIVISDFGEQLFDINIYEFAFKCKEWAFKQGYELFSRILSNDHQHIGNCVVYRVEADPEESLKIMNEKTEQEAIFKACKWILENKA